MKQITSDQHHKLLKPNSYAKKNESQADAIKRLDKEIRKRWTTLEKRYYPTTGTFESTRGYIEEFTRLNSYTRTHECDILDYDTRLLCDAPYSSPDPEFIEDIPIRTRSQRIGSSTQDKIRALITKLNIEETHALLTDILLKL